MHTTADTTPRWLGAFEQHFRTVEKGLLILNIAFFAFCLANWLGWLPFERGFQPLQMVYLSGAMALQPAAWLIKRRSMLAWVALLAASIALLVMGATVRNSRDVALPNAPMTTAEPKRS